ncbi:NAD-binding protein [Sanghuangporus baumii]|nr:NAD-binding protein [Sanghuangporus baumii]
MVNFGEPGSIILIASMAASVAFAKEHWSAYGTSKSAVKQMGRYLACELGPNQIRVNTISPGYIYTNMTRLYLDDYPHLIKEWGAQNPLGRIGRPDDLRGVVAWLASDASSFCTGSDILITGGHHAW